MTASKEQEFNVISELSLSDFRSLLIKEELINT